jgi:hypothetical protein
MIDGLENFDIKKYIYMTVLTINIKDENFEAALK